MKKLVCFLLMLCTVFTSYGTQVVIANMTDEEMYASVYCVNGDTIARGLIPAPGEKNFSGYQKLGVAEYKPFNYNCKKGGTATIIVDRDPANLKASFKKEELAELSMSAQSIGNLETNFFIVKKDERLKVYNSFRWYLFKPLKKMIAGTTSYYLTDPVKKKLEKSLPAILENPYKDMIATVRVGNDLSEQERAYIERRLAHAKEYLRAKVTIDEGKTLPIAGNPPVIAAIFSGGGFRAMIATLGALNGAQQAGLLDVISYTVGLSGSTWALGSWMLSGKPIAQFKDQLLGMLSKGLESISRSELELVGEAIATKMVFDQPITLVDPYGALLANILFKHLGKKRQQVYLSELSKNAPEAWPLGIFTAIRAEEHARMSSWYEFTPYEVGGSWLKMYIPTWAWGRKFINGKSTDFAPEQTLGFNFGTYGSAFGAQFGQTYEEMGQGIALWPVKTLIEKSILPLIKEKRPSSAQVFNFTAGMPTSPIRELKVMQLVDAGSRPGFNLPYPPVSGERPQRKADIMIFIDASAGVPAADFKEVERYARAHNLRFPVIDYTNIGNRTITIFRDEKDPSIPLVIYMPLFNDRALLAQKLKSPAFARFKNLEQFDAQQCMEKSFCNTFNFKYSKKEAELLASLMEFNILANADEIFKAIGQWIQARDKQSLEVRL